jgi:hypothetical protein
MADAGEAPVLRADHALVAALAAGDCAAAQALLDDAFVWIDRDGRACGKADALPAPPLGDESDLAPHVQVYGNVATVQAARDKEFVLRIWIRRGGLWRALVLHEVSQAGAPAPHVPGPRDHDNPCRIIPYAPRSADERDCLAAWQALETAVMDKDPDEWARHVADEFTVVGAARRHGKRERQAVIAEQRAKDVPSAPAPLVEAEMFGFPNAMVMRCEHQPFHGKRYRASRVFVKRDGHWLMAVSYQTTRADAPVVTIA